MGGINSLGGLNNVGLDYRPTITTIAPKTGNANQPLPGADAAPENAPPVKAEAKSFVRELDVLLLNAAGRSVSADVVTNVQETGRSLVEKGVLTQEEASALDRLAADAAEKLKALDKFSGRELAKALMPDKKGGTVWGKGFWGLNAAAKAVKAAIEAQQTLSAELGKFNEHIIGQSGDDAGVDAAMQEAFMELQFQCDRRASEIDSIVFRMYDLAQKDVVNGAAADPQDKALLNATFKELMPREAILMHGTAEAFEKLNAKLAEQMRPLAEKLDAYAADGFRSLGDEEVAALRRDLQTMRNAVADVRANGLVIERDGADGKPFKSQIEVDKSLLGEMDKVLDEAARQIDDARQVSVRRARESFVNEVAALLSPEKAPGGDKVVASGAARKNSEVSGFTQAREAFLQKLRDFAETKLPMDRFDAEIGVCIKNFGREMHVKLEKSLVKVGFDPAAAKQAVKTACGLHIVKAHFKEMMEATDKQLRDNADIGIVTGDVRRILLGETGLANVVEAKIRGFKPGDVDPATDSSNIVGSRTLGAGAAGKTYLLTTKGGEELVFKPELDSRIGLNHLFLGGGGAYLNKQTAVGLNLATQDTAKAFGCEDLVVKYSVGSHDGQFGFFMEKAKGFSGSEFASKKKSAGDGIPPAGLHELPITDEDKLKIQGSIARKLSRLQWLDLITGQGDRHWGNYFVHIDRDTHEVTVKGIDNDASFSSRHVGLQRYTFNKKTSAKFDAELRTVCSKVHGLASREYERRVSMDPAIERKPDGTMTIDLAKAKSPEVKMAIIGALGLQGVALPEEIDKDFYDKLMEMDRNPAKKQEFLDAIGSRISPEALEATKTRLNEAIAHAKKLHADDKVYGDAEWRDPAKLNGIPEIESDAKIVTSDGRKIKVGPGLKCVRQFLERDCPSLYKRDFFHKMFKEPDNA